MFRHCVFPLAFFLLFVVVCGWWIQRKGFLLYWIYDKRGGIIKGAVARTTLGTRSFFCYVAGSSPEESWSSFPTLLLWSGWLIRLQLVKNRTPMSVFCLRRHIVAALTAIHSHVVREKRVVFRDFLHLFLFLSLSPSLFASLRLFAVFLALDSSIFHVLSFFSGPSVGFGRRRR